MRKIFIPLFFTFFFAGEVLARNEIRIVGSSTVYPLITVVAEKFGKSGEFKTPVVEATGTGGGLKLFCDGVGKEYPDIANASRRIKQSEINQCKKNGVTDIAEVKIGYDGIVIANSAEATRFSFEKKDIFNALAKKVEKSGKLIDNPFKTWKEVNPNLPETKIEVYGPPPTSGTRDVFVELVLRETCLSIPAFKAAYKDEKELAKNCGLIREDGAYIESGENDNLIIQKLGANKTAFGIFGYDFMDNNRSKVQGSTISGVEPVFETISSGKYPIARPMYVYVKLAHINAVPGIREFMLELTSETAIGNEGYLIEKGLIPVSQEDLAKTRKATLAKEKMPI